VEDDETLEMTHQEINDDERRMALFAGLGVAWRGWADARFVLS